MNTRAAARALFGGDAEAALRGLDAGSRDPRGRLLVANALCDLGRFDEAEPHYRFAIEARPDSAAFAAFHARHFFDRGAIQDATAEAERALSLDGGHRLARLVLALSRIESGHDDFADIDAIGEADDAAFASRLLLAVESRETEAFHPVFEERSKGPVPPFPPRATGPDEFTKAMRRRFTHAVALRQDERFADALAEWFALLSEAPGDTGTLLAIAETLYLLGRFDDALEFLDRLGVSDREDPDAKRLAALCGFAVGEGDAAALAESLPDDETDVMAEAVDTAADAMAFVLAGRLALENGGRASARQRFASAARLNPLLVFQRWEAFKRR